MLLWLFLGIPFTAHFCTFSAWTALDRAGEGCYQAPSGTVHPRGVARSLKLGFAFQVLAELQLSCACFLSMNSQGSIGSNAFVSFFHGIFRAIGDYRFSFCGYSYTVEKFVPWFWSIVVCYFVGMIFLSAAFNSLGNFPSQGISLSNGRLFSVAPIRSATLLAWLIHLSMFVIGPFAFFIFSLMFSRIG
jgi:hypothetical protein